MISKDAVLTIRILPLSHIQIKEYQPRYIEKVHAYVKLLLDHPSMYAGILYVVRSDTHENMFALLDGHHKYCASIIAGREDALCIIIS